LLICAALQQSNHSQEQEDTITENKQKQVHC